MRAASACSRVRSAISRTLRSWVWRGFRDVGIGVEPAQMEQHGLGLAHLGRDFAVADRLPRLLLQAVDLAGQLPDHILDAGEIGFRRLQPQFGLVAAGVQPGDAGGVFQHAAALFGLGLNDLADLALVNQRRRTRAGGGVGEQESARRGRGRRGR